MSYQPDNGGLHSLDFGLIHLNFPLGMFQPLLFEGLAYDKAFVSCFDHEAILNINNYFQFYNCNVSFKSIYLNVI